MNFKPSRPRKANIHSKANCKSSKSLTRNPNADCYKLVDGHSRGSNPGDEMRYKVNAPNKSESMDNPEAKLQVVTSQKLSSNEELAHAQVSAMHENSEAIRSRKPETPRSKPLKATEFRTDNPSTDGDPTRETLEIRGTDGDSVRETLGTGDIDFATKLLRQLMVGSPKVSGEVLVDVSGSLAALHDIAPRDGIEAMLGVQMVALHDHALDSLRKASRPEVPNNVRDVYANQAVKFARTFSSHVDALNEYRNRATTNVLVVHQAADATVRRTGPHGTAATLEGEDEKAG
jgi:hypothetical protein